MPETRHDPAPDTVLGSVSWSTPELARGSRRDPDLRARVRWLALGLAVAAVTALVLATTLVVQHRRSATDRAAEDVVTAWVDAAAAHDLAALRRVSATDPVWEAVASGEVTAGPYAGAAWSGWMTELFQRGLQIEVSGPWVVSGGTEVAVSTRFVVAGSLSGVVIPHPREHGVEEVGLTEFHLVHQGGRLLVAEVVWLPPW